MLPSNVFAETAKLDQLVLSENKIDNIEDFAFAGLSKLRSLFLNNNSLATLNRNTFAGVENLEQLHLRFNRIETIDGGALQLPMLERIFLSHNRIRTLGDTFFAGTPKLLQVMLNGNGLESIGQSLYGLNALKMIDLSENRIDDIDLSALARMPSIVRLYLRASGFNLNVNTGDLPSGSILMELHLADNGIDASDILQRFKALKNLGLLGLENNKLTELQGVENIGKDFPELVYLQLADNNFSCDYLANILPTLKEQKIIVRNYADGCKK